MAMGWANVRREFSVILAWEVMVLNRTTILLSGLFRNFRQGIIHLGFLLAPGLHLASDRTSPLSAHHCHYFSINPPVSPLIIGACRLGHDLGECSH
jgi:hypothetical protein